MTEHIVSIGIDLGGTKIEVVVLQRPLRGESGSYQLRIRERVPTERERGYEAIVDTTAKMIRDAARKGGVDLRSAAVGVGMPGAVTSDGLVKNSNTVVLNGRPFRSDLMERVGCPVAFENDANCFALAEATLGAARDQQSGVVFGVIMGSGVGAGIVMRGQLWSGPQSLAGEWGHHAVGPWGGAEQEPTHGTLSARAPCYCGQSGCLELYASGVGVEREYQRRTGRVAKLADLVAQRSSDRHAYAVVEELLEAFGRGLANVIDILDPSAVVLGGGVSNLDLLYDEGRRRVAKYVFNDELTTPILRHQLGDSAGVIGAALLDRP